MQNGVQAGLPSTHIRTTVASFHGFAGGSPENLWTNLILECFLALLQNQHHQSKANKAQNAHNLLFIDWLSEGVGA